MTLDEWYRKDRLPHIYCPGCGNGTVLNCIINAVDELDLDQNTTTFVSGIGCSSRSAGYTSCDSLHTTHGRAIPFATGIKLAKPKNTVIVITGDGDLSAIGGNHFIHACRRNIDITVICMNNSIYGMTGGQCSPCTPNGSITTTTPYGSTEIPFDLCSIAESASANYVSRWTTYHVKQLVRSIKTGICTPGFAFIEVLSQCPTSFGNKNKMKLATQMIDMFHRNAVLKQRVDRDGIQLSDGQFVIGEFTKRNNPVWGCKS
ncbi:MAG TPA: thiamine pyrophosphate-dependent enzyme [Methanocorpusculum sp.]|nr:thiamine pyrophosphate-dependent enzyme [Methanocorpusculum sp.]